MRMDVLEMRILYEEVIHDILFDFFLLAVLILTPSLLLSALCCAVFIPRDQLSIKECGQHVAAPSI